MISESLDGVRRNSASTVWHRSMARGLRLLWREVLQPEVQPGLDGVEAGWS